MNDSVFIGGAEDGSQSLLLKRANRHGLIAGATGTGKKSKAYCKTVLQKINYRKALI